MTRNYGFIKPEKNPAGADHRELWFELLYLLISGAIGAIVPTVVVSIFWGDATFSPLVVYLLCLAGGINTSLIYWKRGELPWKSIVGADRKSGEHQGNCE